MQHVFIHPAGQDDNLGDSALRVGLLQALRAPQQRLHVLLEGQTSDYLSAMPLQPDDVVYESRRAWLAARRKVARPVYVVNAGEINPVVDRAYPHPRRAVELRDTVKRGGVVIAAGLGLKDPSNASRVNFDIALRDASIMSWRDQGSAEAAGFGTHAPDWAFALGSAPSTWLPDAGRHRLAVTLRFDRPWPSDTWFTAVRRLAARTSTQIVTVAQVARDAPLAVRLAEALGGQYLVANSTSHSDLDQHVRQVYRESLAVVSDRAHALIMGATEGAYPLGSAADPQKIIRLLTTAGVGALTGHHSTFNDRQSRLETELPTLASAMNRSRAELIALSSRIHDVLGSVAD